MYKEAARILLYQNPKEGAILSSFCDIFRQFDQGDYDPFDLIDRIYTQMKALLDLSTRYGFDDNLWHNYLTFLLLTSENSFSLAYEKKPVQEGSVNHFARSDFAVFKQLFDFDFTPIEQALQMDCFTTITHYHAITKKKHMYHYDVSHMVQTMTKQIEDASDSNEIFTIVTSFYKQYGVGMFGLNKAFRIRSYSDHHIAFLPIHNMDCVQLSDLIGYKQQKQALINNTLAFVKGQEANNVLLYGDSGTGKSTSVKAIVNEFYADGLRMIEIYKHQFKDLSTIIARIKNRNYRFIIYMDDLSFEEFEIEYKFLKAVIEGGVETKPDNVVIYATSNRRHLIRETWSDRSEASQDELHHMDTMQEKLSLVARFGIRICYERPNQDDYFAIVHNLAKKYPQITLSEEELQAQARIWALQHGGMSGRVAQQLINQLAGQGDVTIKNS